MPGRADPLGRLGRVHIAGMGIVVALGENLGRASIFVEIACLVGDRELAASEIDVEPVRLDEIEEMSLGLFAEPKQTLGLVRPVFGLQFQRPKALAGSHLAAIAARGPVTEAMGFEDDDGGAGAGQMNGRRQAGETAAHDRDIDA